MLGWLCSICLFLLTLNKNVGPFTCITFTNIRQNRYAGVEKLITLYDNNVPVEDEHIFIGNAIRLNTPIVVSITGTPTDHVQEYFRDLLVSEDHLSEQ